MPSRRNRRLLFEVAGRASSRPPVRVAPRTRSPASADARPGGPASEPATPTGRSASSVWQRPELWAVAAGLVVVAVVAFYAGRRYERFAARNAVAAADHPAGLRSDRRADEPLEPRTTAAPPARTVRTPAPASPAPKKPVAVPPRVELKPGYSYVVVQHFPLKRRKDAEAAVRFLLDAGVPAALLRGADYRVIVTEPFDTLNKDRSVARREQQRAAKMLARIRELGKAFNREHGYNFKDCYLLPIR